ncbi:MAG: dockerin type I repeat-containing protein [Clostridia bacterium]|nr:dockerin type I repeat-containing protein [Clostridia bacterium]MBQ3154837.1 dockerin type I repeat-containing protein [Clostridia bacterium]
MKKKLFCILLCVLLLALTASPVFAEERYNRFGDLNNDGETDSLDYMRLKRYVLGTNELSQKGWYRADVNYDGAVDATDYMILKREVMGTYDRPIIRGSVDEMTDGQLYGHIHRLLGYDRPEGKLEVVFTDGNISEAAEILASHGLTGGIDDIFTIEDVTYGYAYLDCDETDIRELLFALLRDERVTSASPEYYAVPD